MNIKTKKSIKRKLFWMIVLSSIVPLLLLGFFSVIFVTNSANTSLNQRLDEVLLSSDDLLKTTIESQIYQTETLKNTLLEQDLLDQAPLTPTQQKAIETVFFQTLNRDLGTMNLYYVSVQGEAVGTDALPEIYDYPSHKNWGIYRFVEESDTAFYANPYVVNDSFYTAYSIVHPVTIDGERVGTLILDVSTESIQSLFSSVKGTAYGYVQFILASKYNTVMYNDSYFRNNIGLVQNVLTQDVNSTGSASLKDNTLGTRVNDEMGYQIYGLIHNQLIYDQGKLVACVLVLLIITTIGVSFYIGRGLTQSIVTPIHHLVNKMHAYENANCPMDLGEDRDEIVLLSNQFDLLLERIEHVHALNLEKQDLMRQAELKSLMSQIKPHFINNTLDSIKWNPSSKNMMTFKKW